MINPYIAPGLPRNLLSLATKKPTDMQEAIIQKVCDYYKLPVYKVLSRCRQPELSLARHVIFYFLYQAGLKLQQIGTLFKLHHTTVLHGLKRIRGLSEVDKSILRDLKKIDLLV